jgi:predicted nucleic acid-binding protein
MFVVDASVIVAWCLEDETSDVADAAVERLFAEGGVSPAHWPVEVANALHSAVRRGRLQPGEIDQLRPRLDRLPVEIVPVELSTAFGAVSLARIHELSVYDALYLDLATLRGLGLATVDGRLAEAGRSAGVSLIGA